MDFTHFYNPAAAVIVFGGTALAAVLRCGLSATVTTGKALTDLFRPRFRADAVRAVLAGQAADIRANGLLRAQPCRSGDREFDEATNAMLSARSVSGLLETHEAFRATRRTKAGEAAGMLAQAADLAPVFGLAGTLVSLTQLPADGVARGAFSSAIGMAVLTTLYGLIFANLVLGPLAKMVERRARDEEAARQSVIDWLVQQVALATPRHARHEADHHGGHTAARHGADEHAAAATRAGEAA